MEDQKAHWENVYATRQPHEVSWTQEMPATSLACIHGFNLPKDAAIIDIGGGDSKLVDYLLEDGHTNITVLDISAKALERAQARLGDKARQVTWIVSDIAIFQPTVQYDLWHDRAAFHFLITPEQRAAYLETARNHVQGYMVIGTFSDKGPTKCSGLEIAQYSEATLQAQLANGFEKLHCLTEEHTTPFNTTQNFLFCAFKRIE